MKSTNPRDVALIFRDYSRKIHARALPEDPSFLRISVSCGKVRLSLFSVSASCPPFSPFTRFRVQIEQWCERHYPSFVMIKSVSGGVTYDPNDTRSRVVEAAQARDRELQHEKRIAELREKHPAAAAQLVQKEESSFGEMLMYVGTAFILVFGISIGAAWLLIKYYDLKLKA